MKTKSTLVLILFVVVVGVCYADDILGFASAVIGVDQSAVRGSGSLMLDMHLATPPETQTNNELSNPPEPWFPTPLPYPKP